MGRQHILRLGPGLFFKVNVYTREAARALPPRFTAARTPGLPLKVNQWPFIDCLLRAAQPCPRGACLLFSHTRQESCVTLGSRFSVRIMTLVSSCLGKTPGAQCLLFFCVYASTVPCFLFQPDWGLLGTG